MNVGQAQQGQSFVSFHQNPHKCVLLIHTCMQTTHQYVFSVGTGSTPQISYCRWGGLRTWDKTDFIYFFKYEWGDICNLWSLWERQLKPTAPKYSQSITKCFPSAQEAFKRQCSSPKSTTLFWYDASSYTLIFDTGSRIDTRRFKTNFSNNKNTLPL